MALIQLGAMITSIKGSILGWTFQNNGAGTIIRARSGPRRTSTSRQQQSHQTHQKRLVEWQKLLLSEKQLWNAYASLYPKTDKFGVVKKINGQNFYESVNTALEIISQPLTNTPPAHTLPAAVPPFAIIVSDTDLFIELESPFDFSLNELIIWSTAPTSRSTFSINQLRKFLGLFNPASFPLMAITTLWENATDLPWSSAAAAIESNIIVCLQSVSKSSGITSPILCNIVNINEQLTEEETLIYYT